jgi:membrane carboxypeptidase/penicillin-binding protein
VFYVIGELEEKYGKEVVEKGGLQVYTTIDPELQEIAEQAIVDGAAANARFNATNAALVSIDHKTGQIVALVGSKDYYDEEIDGNVNVATSYRQPGSSFKPYVYAMAFYNRYTPATTLYDVRTKFGSKYPNNYDGGFRGPISIRRGLAQSRNITALKAYYLAGEQEPILDLAERMGIQFLTRDRDYGWSLALGTAEIRLLDHTSAFGVFANGGKRIPPKAILKVTNAQGDVLEEIDENDKGEEVLDPQIAYLITHILSDTNARLGPSMTVPGQVNAAKTGTSNKKVGGINIPSNLLTMGYTTHLSTGVWAGNSDDSKSGNLAAHANGYEAAAPIFKRFMTEAHNIKGYQYEEFPVPPGIQTRTIGPEVDLTPDQTKFTDVFASFSMIEGATKHVTTALIDTRNDLLANNYCPSQFVEEKTFQEHHCIDPGAYPEWEIGVQLWATGMAEEDDSNVLGAAPTETSPLCTKEHFESSRSVKISTPSNYSKVEAGKLSISVKTKSTFSIENVAFYLDGALQSTSYDAPYAGEIRLSRFLEPGSTHTVQAVLTDEYGYTSHSSIEIRIKGEPVKEEKPPEEEPPVEEPPAEEALPPEDEEPLPTDEGI